MQMSGGRKGWVSLPGGRRISASAFREAMEEAFPVDMHEPKAPLLDDAELDDVIKELNAVKAALAQLRKRVEPLLSLQAAHDHAVAGKLRFEAPPSVVHSEHDVWK
jgi:hypothetical protein